MAPSARKLRALTLTLPDYLQPSLWVDGKPYVLRNFSEEGIGLWMPQPAPFGLKKGSKVNGDLAIGKEIHPVQLEVRFEARGALGLSILHKSVELGALFRRLLEPTVYASGLTVHPKSATLDASIGYPRLWYATRGTELLVWFDPATRLTLGIQIRWLGQWVFRERKHAAHTGYLEGFEAPNHGQHVKPGELLIVHGPADKELLGRAGQFLAAVPGPLPGYLLWQFLESGNPVELPEALLVPPKLAKAS